MSVKIHFAPQDDDQPSGTVSFASWNNPDLQAAIRRAFGESPREEITDIYIDRQGVKALFVNKPESR
jgi:hypothetical protein